MDPDILALDFDGVLCQGLPEYFESSRRAYLRVWPGGEPIADDVYPAFCELRPVILSGWEMPTLLRAIASRVPHERIDTAWPATRDDLLARDPRPREALVKTLRDALDDARRAWAHADRAGWLAHHGVYHDPAEIRPVLGRVHQRVIVTTKEGEFVRWLLAHWRLDVDDVQGKETGEHKCENLRAIRSRYEAERGTRPVIWFVEDRLETLQHVTTHPDLDDVGLFLADWGYNSARAKEQVRRDPRIRLLAHHEFPRAFTTWGTSD
jgi:hypothetical protein